MKRRALLLTSHGNEPYLLGVSIALKSGADAICVPHYYHGHNHEPDQVKILREEFPQDLDKIFLSNALGKILKPLLRDFRDYCSYSDYVERFFGGQDIYNKEIAKIEERLKNLLRNGIDAISLSYENTSTRFYDLDFALALNVGLPIKSFIYPTFFAFTGRMSDIHRIPLPHDGENLTSIFAPLANYWQELEDSFSRIYIPKINALSHTKPTSRSSVTIYTPPLSRPMDPTKKPLISDSFLVVPSGTGLDKEALAQIITLIKKDYQIVSYSNNVQGVKRTSPNVFTDSRLLAVISRGGWGTTWKCLIHGKPLGFLDTKYSEDPEIAHSIFTLRTLDIGFPLNPSSRPDIVPPRERLIQQHENIQKLLLESAGDFTINGQDFSRNGIDYVANNIKSLLTREINH